MKIRILLLPALIAILSGCAGIEAMPLSNTTTVMVEMKPMDKQEGTMTGSRLPRKTTDRMLSEANGKEILDGPKSNPEISH